MRDYRNLADIGVDRRHLGNRNALEVHNATASLKEGASLAGAGRKARIGDTLVLNGQVGKHTLGRGDLIHGSQVNATESLDIYRTTILVKCK